MRRAKGVGVSSGRLTVVFLHILSLDTLCAAISNVLNTMSCWPRATSSLAIQIRLLTWPWSWNVTKWMRDAVAPVNIAHAMASTAKACGRLNRAMIAVRGKKGWGRGDSP